MSRKLLLALLFCLCSGCTFVSTLRISATPDPATSPAMPAGKAVSQFAAYLVSKGLKEAHPDSFGAKGRYEFRTYHDEHLLGDQDDEYLTIYSGDADTVIVEVTRISDSVKPVFPDDMVARTLSQAAQYLREATGNTYKVVVIYRS